MNYYNEVDTFITFVLTIVKKNFDQISTNSLEILTKIIWKVIDFCFHIKIY